MSTRQKILDALDCALDDISEARLLDILIDAYEEKKKQIAKLEAENIMERRDLYEAQKAISREMHELRKNPLLLAHGRYFFRAQDGALISVDIQGQRIQVCQRWGNIDHRAQQLTPEEWSRL